MSWMLKGFYAVISPKICKWIFSYMKLQKIMTTVNMFPKRNDLNVHRLLRFEGFIFLDCGIFSQFRKEISKKEITKYRDELIERYKRLKPNVASSLDVPSLLWHPIEVKKQRSDWSIENFIYMKEKLGDSIPLFVGVSAFSPKSVEIIGKKIKKKIGDIRLIGLGGQVPLIKKAVLKPQLGKISLHTIFYLKKMFQDSHLHVYGAGGHRWYMLARLLGADSADYAGFYQLTGRGQIVLPGVGLRYILKRIEKETRNGFRTYVRSEEELLKLKEFTKLLECSCPACKENSFEDLEYNRKLRLIHNMYVSVSEATIVDNILHESGKKELIKHIKNRLSSSHLKPLMSYAIRLTQK